MAQHKENDSSQLYDGREKQYMYALSRLFTYNLPVYGVLSETYGNNDFKALQFPFQKLLVIPSTKELHGELSHSKKEFVSIKELLKHIDLNDENSWIIKISGRYMIYNDTFINTVKNVPQSIKAVVRKCDNDTQMYTFLFALRFKYFKDFFLNYDIPNNINLERVLLIYLETHLADKEIQVINELGILCNIADCNVFTYF